MTPSPEVSPSGHVTGTLAAFALDATWEGLPEEVQKEAVRATVNWIGCAIGGSTSKAVDDAVVGLGRAYGPGTVPLIARAESASVANAALLNCLSSALDAFDDTHIQTSTHPTGPVAAALLALGEQEVPMSGREFLASLAVGVEIQLRISKALRSSENYQIGWWMTGFSGVVGTAAACGRALGATLHEMTSMLGIAATQSAGLRATHGSFASPLVPSFASRNGLTAAFLATSDYAAGPAIIEGRNGLLDVFAPDVDPSMLVTGLGTHWSGPEVIYKPFPGGFVAHPSIDAALRLAAMPDFVASELRGLTAKVHPFAVALTSIRFPQSAMESINSLGHWVGVALLRRYAGLAEMQQDVIESPDVRAIEAMLEIEVGDALEVDQAELIATFADGRTERIVVEHARGSEMNPMSDDDLSEKFLSQAVPIIGEGLATSLLENCWSLPDLPDVRTLAHGSRSENLV